MIKVLIADDHKIFRVGIKRIIDDEKDMRVVAEAENGRQALEAAVRIKPDAIVLDFEMPEMNGLETTEAIIREIPDAKILILTVYDSAEHAGQFMKAGALGFLPKVISPDELPSAIRNIVAGRSHISFIKKEGSSNASPVNAPAQPGTDEKLPVSKREREILILLAKGKAVKEIAYELNLGETTVRTHRQRIMTKLNRTNNSEIIRFALAHNLITVE